VCIEMHKSGFFLFGVYHEETCLTSSKSRSIDFGFGVAGSKHLTDSRSSPPMVRKYQRALKSGFGGGVFFIFE
jgi:hypothetical protein